MSTLNRLGRWLRRFLLALAMVAILVFSATNRGDLTFSFFPFPYEIAMPKVLFMLLWFTAGAMFGALFIALKNMRLNSALKRSENKCGALEQEVAGLRAEAAQHLPEVPKLPSLS